MTLCENPYVAIDGDELAAVRLLRTKRGLPVDLPTAVPLSPADLLAWVRELSCLAKAAGKRRRRAQAKCLRRRAAELVQAVLADWPLDDFSQGLRQCQKALAGLGDHRRKSAGEAQFSPAEAKVVRAIFAFIRERGEGPGQSELREFARARGEEFAWATVSRAFSKLRMKSVGGSNPKKSSTSSPLTLEVLRH